MMLTPLTKDQVRNGWPWLSALLYQCVRQDPALTMAEVYAGLVNGPDLAVTPHGWAEGVMVFEITPERVLWIKYVAGRVAGGPKARVAAIREAMESIERVAANAGCCEVRVCGRDWSSVLTEYELIPHAPEPNLLRKVLKIKEAA